MEGGNRQPIKLMSDPSNFSQRGGSTTTIIQEADLAEDLVVHGETYVFVNSWKTLIKMVETEVD